MNAIQGRGGYKLSTVHLLGQPALGDAIVRPVGRLVELPDSGKKLMGSSRDFKSPGTPHSTEGSSSRGGSENWKAAGTPFRS